MGKEYKTEGRSKIMDILRRSSGGTLNVQQIGAALEEENMPLNKTTIYRYLGKLEEEGTVVQYRDENGRRAVYQLVDQQNRCDRHLHMKCVECGAMLHMDDSFMDTIQEHVYSAHGFMIQCRNSVIYGLCKDCMCKNW